MSDRASGSHEHPDLGPYLLGTAVPRERRAAERHLGHCPACRAEIRSLASTAALLALLSPADRHQIAAEFGVPAPARRPTAPRRGRASRRAAGGPSVTGP